MLKEYTCKRCNYQWHPRKEKPFTCPKCRSPYWNKEKKIEEIKNDETKKDTINYGCSRVIPQTNPITEGDEDRPIEPLMKK